MKKRYESPKFDFKEIIFIENILGDSKLPPETPASGEGGEGPSEFGPDF